MINKKTENTLSSLYGQEGLNDSFISFQSDLLEISKKYKKKIKSPTIVLPDKNLIKQHFENGFPIITFVPLSLPHDILVSCWKDLIEVFQSYQILSADVSSKTKSNSQEKLVKGISKAVTSFDNDALQKLAKSVPMESSTMTLISRELVKPIFHSLADHVRESISFENWTEGYCPICGILPSFARFSKEEEGKRYLWCERCEIEWGFQRICCPFCRNTDHNKLKFLTTNHREELRIDVCENCQGYIKTIDERITENDEETIYIKENVASLYLDMVAEEKGYTIQIPTKQETKITFYSDQNFN
jgi:formate dehydrogenase accessory protein FdhE